MTGPLADARVEVELDLDQLRAHTRAAVKQVGQDGEAAGRSFGDGFSRGAQAKVRKAQDDLIKASDRVVTARTRELDAAGRVRLAEAELAKLRSAKTPDIDLIRVAEERLARARRGLTLESTRLASAQRQLVLARQDAKTVTLTPQDEQNTRRQGEQAGKQFGDGFRLSVRDAFANVFKIQLARGLIGAPAAVSRVTALGAAFGVLGVQAAAAAVAVGQFAAAIVPVVGIATLLPAALLAGGAAVATLKVVTAGLSDAFKAIGEDQTKFAEATKNLAPAARSVVTEVRKLQPELQRLRVDVQQAAFAPLVGQATALAKVLAGPVRDAMSSVAAEGGRAALGISRFLQQQATVSVITGSFTTLRGVIANLRPALVPLLAAFRDLAAVALPVLVRMSDTAGQWGRHLADTASEAAKSGQALAWITNAQRAFAELRDILGGIVGIFGQITRAGGGTGGILASVSTAIQGIQRTLASHQGQDALAQIFTSLRSVAVTLQPLLVTIVRALGDLTPVFARLAVAAAPGIDALIRLVVQLVTAAGPGLKAFIESLSTALEGLAKSGALSALGSAFGAFAQVVGQFVVAAGPGIATFFTTLGNTVQKMAESGVFEKLGAALGDLLGAIAPLLPKIGDALVRILEALVPVIEQLAATLADPAIQKAIIFILEALVRIVELLSEFTIGVLHAFAVVAEDIKTGAEQWATFFRTVSKGLGIFSENLDNFFGTKHWGQWVADAEAAAGNLPVILDQQSKDIARFADDAQLRFGTLAGAYMLMVQTIGEAGAAAIVETEMDRMKISAATVGGTVDLLKTSWDAMWFAASNTGKSVEAQNDLDADKRAADGLAASLHGVADAHADMARRLADTAALDAIHRRLDSLKDAAFAAGRAIDTVQAKTGGGNFAAQPRAAGGVFTRPTVVEVSEFGQREVIIPVTRPQRAIQLAHESGLVALLERAGVVDPARGNGAGGTTTVNAPITVTSNAADPELVAHKVAARLARWAVR